MFPRGRATSPQEFECFDCHDTFRDCDRSLVSCERGRNVVLKAQFRAVDSLGRFPYPGFEFAVVEYVSEGGLATCHGADDTQCGRQDLIEGVAGGNLVSDFVQRINSEVPHSGSFIFLGKKKRGMFWLYPLVMGAHAYTSFTF